MLMLTFMTDLHTKSDRYHEIIQQVERELSRETLLAIFAAIVLVAMGFTLGAIWGMGHFERMLLR